MRRIRKRDSDVHLTGGGVPLLDLSCFAALTAVALARPLMPLSPLPFPSNTLQSEHMISLRLEGRGSPNYSLTPVCLKF